MAASIATAMQLLNGNLILSASDLVGSQPCEHLVQVDVAFARGDLKAVFETDPILEMLATSGREHERGYLESLRQSGKNVVEIPDPVRSVDGYRRAQELTVEAMRAGADIIYQGVLFDGQWVGLADFLERVDGSTSNLGDYSYEVVDTKLAKKAKAKAITQITAYSEQLAELQGRMPDRMHLLLGDGKRQTMPVADQLEAVREAKQKLLGAVAAYPSLKTEPEPVTHCGSCRWSNACTERWRERDHLTFVAGIRQEQVRRLAGLGIHTLEDFAHSAPFTTTAGSPDETIERLRKQAALQLRQRETGQVHFETLRTQDARQALAELPEPSPADMYLDLEGDPFTPGQSLEYLMGILEVPFGNLRYAAYWGLTREDERVAFEKTVDHITARRRADPSAHVFHYASYEISALKRMAASHGSRQAEVEALIQEGAFVDLYKLVKRSVLVSQESYSIKKLEPLYMGQRSLLIADGGSSMVVFRRWQQTGDPALLSQIEDYNRDDTVSTWKLRDWLLERKRELVGVPARTLAVASMDGRGLAR